LGFSWEQTIQQLLALVGGENSPFTIPSLAIHSGSFLLLFILAYGVATPGGIFMPSIMVCTTHLGKETPNPENKNSQVVVYVINY
jgi:chloride channel 7